MGFLRRSRHTRQTSWSLFDTSSIASGTTSSFDEMSISNSVTSSSSRRRDTGFPESFCGNRNTSLPHPDADTSPNACIYQEDIAVSRVMHRHRRSFLARNKHATSHGLLTPDMYTSGDIVPVASHAETATGVDLSTGHTMNRPTSGGGDSFASASTGDHNDDAVPNSPTQHYSQNNRHSRLMSTDSSASVSKRKSFMGKLGIHRHHD